MATLHIGVGFMLSRLFPDTDCEMLSLDFDKATGRVSLELEGPSVPKAKEIEGRMHIILDNTKQGITEKVEFVPVGP